jgi:hypothetical protein
MKSFLKELVFNIVLHLGFWSGLYMMCMAIFGEGFFTFGPRKISMIVVLASVGLGFMATILPLARKWAE